MWLLLVALIALVVWVVGIYNKLQSMMQDIREQLSNLQAAFKKRIDLSNQIIDIASGYSEHEKLTYMTVTKSNQAVEKMMALSQAYPDLKANQTYQTLMTQLEGLEATLLERRERYNAKVKLYNSYRNSFPNVLIAGRLSFDVAPFFEIEDPDFANKMKVFQRDDTEALQSLLSSGVKAVQHSTATVKQKMQSQNPNTEQAIEENKPCGEVAEKKTHQEE